MERQPTARRVDVMSELEVRDAENLNQDLENQVAELKKENIKLGSVTCPCCGETYANQYSLDLFDSVLADELKKQSAAIKLLRDALMVCEEINTDEKAQMKWSWPMSDLIEETLSKVDELLGKGE